MKSILFLVLFSVISAQAELLRGADSSVLSLEQALSGVKPGSVLVLGELHYASVVSDAQMQVLETLRKNGLKVSVGMEFYSYLDQNWVDDYRSGALKETEFLAKVGWGSASFDNYRRQTLFPLVAESSVLALNAPRALTGKIASKGLGSLNAADWALLPPDLTRGNDDYYERFVNVMGQHVPAEKIENYFMAQSVWDETMAWTAQKFMQGHPDQVLVIIVGEFHVQYGGGLPDRLKARGLSDITTLSFVNLHGLTPDETEEQLKPSVQYGARADFIWTTDFEE